jgi:predicted nuclease of restriction endonuclease-like (RecB) superfamily
MKKKSSRRNRTGKVAAQLPGKGPRVPAYYRQLLREITTRIQHAQTRAVLAANVELVRLYWDIGRMIDQRQQEEGWGAGVIPRLSRDLRNELPEVKGFSERNIGRMIAFYRAYPEPGGFLPQAVAKLESSEISSPAAAKLPSPRNLPQPVAKSKRRANVPQPVAQLAADDDSLLWRIPWGHHALLLEKVKDPDDRRWYMEQTLANGWSRNVLTTMIGSQVHRRAGQAVTNFDALLPAPQSELAKEMLKDPYLFDFLTLEEPFHERELETQLVRHVEKFLLELGQGFAFVGRQHPLKVAGEDYYIDLLFYHLRLRAFVVIDLKTGPFKPEYAGKLNFYCNVVNEQLRHADDGPTIGLILCQTKNRVLAEYALSGIEKPIGVSSYELTRALPNNLRSALPTVEEIEEELAAVEIDRGRSGGSRTRS